jgi:hypothetical protein
VRSTSNTTGENVSEEENFHSDEPEPPAAEGEEDIDPEEKRKAEEKVEDLNKLYEDEDRPTVVVPDTQGTLTGTAFADGKYEGDPTENPMVEELLEKGRSEDLERDPDVRVTVPDDAPEPGETQEGQSSSDSDEGSAESKDDSAESKDDSAGSGDDSEAMAGSGISEGSGKSEGPQAQQGTQAEGSSRA